MRFTKQRRSWLRAEDCSRVHSAWVAAGVSLGLIAAVLVLSAARPAEDASILPAAVGWHSLPDTKIASNCPQDPEIHGVIGCRAVTAAWNGAIADTKRNRLIIWGGGHTDYYGNEVYALDLNRSRMSLLIPPTSPPIHCVEEQKDGTPSSRHTYANLAYIAHADKMFSFGGGPACDNPMGSDGAWALDLATLHWERKDPIQGGKPDGGRGFAIAAYDPGTKKVFLNDSYSLWEYDLERNSYKLRNRDATIDDGMYGVIDPERHLLVAFGRSKVRVFRLGGGDGMQKWDRAVKGCDELRDSDYPGLAYDPVSSRVVGWVGGDAVYIFDPDTKSCTTQTFPGGPGEAQGNGTYGRFNYFPAFDVFVLVNDWQQDAFLLRLRPADR